MEKIPTNRPDTIEARFAQLNLDSGYHVQYLTGHNPVNGRYIFQPQIKSITEHTVEGYNLAPLEENALMAYATLLQKDFQENAIEATVIGHTDPITYIEIVV